MKVWEVIETLMKLPAGTDVFVSQGGDVEFYRVPLNEIDVDELGNDGVLLFGDGTTDPDLAETTPTGASNE